MHKLAMAWLLIFSSQLWAEPLYWSAKRGGLEYWLIGSVHVGEKSMFPLPKKVNQYLAQSDGLIVEANLDEAPTIQYPTATVRSTDVLSKQQQKELIGIANLLQMNPNDVLSAPPWIAALTLQMQQIQYLGYRAEDGVDLNLINQAKAQGIEVLGLESLQFQIDLLSGQKEGGKELLTSTIEQFDHNESAMHCLIDSWKAGDLEKLNQFAGLTEVSSDFEANFLTKRNYDWADKLNSPSWLPQKKGKYLVVVGSLHLIGEQSVVELLKLKGFKVKQLSRSQRASCEFKY